MQSISTDINPRIEEVSDSDRILASLVCYHDLESHETLPRRAIDRKARLGSRLRHVKNVARQGGSTPLRIIESASGAEAQYRLLMAYYKELGIDRPTIRPWRPVSLNERLAIIKEYERGTPMKEIGQMFNRSPALVYSLIHDNQALIVPLRFNHCFLTEKEKLEIVKAHQEGLSTRKIATKVNKSDSTVWLFLKREKLITPRRGKAPVKITEEERAKARELRELGLSQRQIAARLGRHRAVIGNIVKDIHVIPTKQRLNEFSKSTYGKHFSLLNRSQKAHVLSVINPAIENGIESINLPSEANVAPDFALRC